MLDVFRRRGFIIIGYLLFILTGIAPAVLVNADVKKPTFENTSLLVKIKYCILGPIYVYTLKTLKTLIYMAYIRYKYNM